MVEGAAGSREGERDCAALAVPSADDHDEDAPGTRSPAHGLTTLEPRYAP